MKKPVNYKISDNSYWKVGVNASRMMMGKSEFVDLLIQLFADKINLDYNQEIKKLAEKIMMEKE